MGGGHRPSTVPARSGRRAAWVIGSEVLGSLVRLSLEIPGWDAAGPGQFAMLHPEPSRSFLPRPFSISEQEGEMVAFLVAEVGEATREICRLTPGEQVWVLGPMGRGFDLDQILAGGRRLVVVGGGAGVAPFPLLLASVTAETIEADDGSVSAHAQRLRTAATREVVVLLGFRDAVQAGGGRRVEAAVSELTRRGVTCRMETVAEDGSHGAGRLVTDALASEVAPGDSVVACGPAAMARAVWDVCSAVRDVQAWFSLETFMACGVGSCHGCVVPAADGSILRVCHDGPVFSGRLLYGETGHGALAEPAVPSGSSDERGGSCRAGSGDKGGPRV